MASQRSAGRPVTWWRAVPPGVALLGVYSSVLVLFLLVPLGVLLARVATLEALPRVLASPLVLEALRLSLVTTLATLALTVALGTPLAYLLARQAFPGREVLDTLLDLPLVLPPAVAGVALLLTLGRRGALGPALAMLGIEVSFTTAAVVLAQLFVAAPFYVKAARAGFESVDPELEHVSASLGVSALGTFWRVTVPLALPALLGGAVLTWARALGEFGATIMFAGNLTGRTQTMPLAIYAALERDLGAALALAGLLVGVSFLVLVAFKALARHTALGSAP